MDGQSLGAPALLTPLAVLRALGANCGNGFVHFALVEQGRLLDVEPRRYVMPRALEGGERLVTAHADLVRDLGRLGAARIGLFIPTFPHQPSYPDARARAAVETLLELAAGTRVIPLEIVSAPRVRSVLKLSAGERIADVISDRLDLTGDPMYWTAGRAEAAAAAWVIQR